MKIISEAVRLIVFFALVSLVTSSLEQVHSVSKVQHILFDMDEALSENASKEIQSYVHMLRMNGSYNPGALVDHLPERFNCIAQIESQLLPHNTAKLTITTHAPLACISADQVITVDGVILSQQVFTEKLIKELDRVELAGALDSEKIPVFVKTVADSIQADLFKSYRMTWVDEHTICLTDKNHPQITIVCSNEKLPDLSMQKKCADLVHDKMLQKPDAQWKADIRFDDQIIISMDKGGQNGTYV
jgi:uncharacterized protein YcfL